MELSESQKEIVNSPYQKILVNAASSAGKTSILTERVRFLLKDGVNPKSIAVITFTNMAAAEMRKRLGEDNTNDLFIGTIHSLANRLLLMKGIDTTSILVDEEFDKLFKLVKQHPECIRPYEYVLLDEAQDSDQDQFEFILDMINPDGFFIVGDERQSIYQFRNSRPDLFRAISYMQGVHTYDLNENYRNKFNILKFAKDLIRPTGIPDNSFSMRKGNGTVMETPFSTTLIIDKLKEEKDFNKWAILTRTNAEIENMSALLSRYNIPFETFKQKDLTREELQEKLVNNTVKILTVHSAKGLEWDNVITIGMRCTPKEERNVCYVAATRARENLIWTYTPKKEKPKGRRKKVDKDIVEW